MTQNIFARRPPSEDALPSRQPKPRTPQRVQPLHSKTLLPRPLIILTRKIIRRSPLLKRSEHISRISSEAPMQTPRQRAAEVSVVNEQHITVLEAITISVLAGATEREYMRQLLAEGDPGNGAR